jgi:signal transduction histidine kinase/CheY-like chemotaxis protein
MTRILIVDDKPENLYMLRVLLAGHGHEVEEARHGAEALAKARQSPPDLVISDLLMPVMDGYTLLRHWKTDEQFKLIPFIVYTATYTEPRDEQLAMDLGADAFIIKPTEPGPFMALIQKVLAKQANGVQSVKLPTDGEDVQLRQYNKVLIRRLEIKMDQLQQANRDLERDIAARQIVEEALRKSEALLNEVGRIAKIGGWEMDLITRKASWTRGTYDIVEIEPGKPIPGPDEHLSYYLPKYRPLVTEAMRALVEENKPLDFEAQLITPKGNVKWCHAIGRAVCEGDRCVKIHGTLQDITERKAREREIQRLNHLYAILSGINHSITRIKSREELFQEICRIATEHAAFKVVWIGWCDPETQQVVPVGRAGDSEGYLDKIKVYADDRPEGRGPVGTCIREGKTAVFSDFQNDPRALPWREAATVHGLRAAAAVPVYFHGKACGAFTVYASEPNVFQDKEVALLEEAGDDISFALENLEREVQRKQAAEEIRKLNIELEQRVVERTAELQAANKELDAFSHSVSHDLRAPLRSINGFASMLTEDCAPQLNEEGRRLLGTICGEASRMSKMIDDLLAFSRLGRQSMQLEQIDMTALAQSMFDKCAAQTSGREIQLNLHPLPSVHGDTALLSHVWSNLISNAIKYTRRKPVATIEITGRTDVKGGTIYCVKDNGAGFDMQYAQKLFGVFQRLHADAEFEGTGVGLSLVQRIVQRHGGRVWAEGKIDEGAAFYFALPEVTTTAS